MLKLPDGLTAEAFLSLHWQKEPLFMPGALSRLRPSVSRNELAWLATLDDVESRLVWTDRDGARPRYRAEGGPFDDQFLASLPATRWRGADIRERMGHVQLLPAAIRHDQQRLKVAQDTVWLPDRIGS